MHETEYILLNMQQLLSGKYDKVAIKNK